ncbi:MAG TPA: hypothetical protein PK871_03815, partial [Mycobacterium sp.]|nr:hypothetical protein [Mycobacterium sp.]
MSRTTTRVAAATAMATAGFFWTAPLAGHFAVADPNVGGVPCISIVQNVITSPPDLSNGVPGAASSILTPKSPTAGGPTPPASVAGSVPVPPASAPGAPGTPGAARAAIPPASTPGAPGSGAVAGVPTPPAGV